MTEAADEIPDDVRAQLADAITAHRTAELAAEDALAVAAFYRTLCDNIEAVEDDDVVAITLRWMSYTWSGGEG